MANVVVLVKTSMSAAASTPVYLAMTGAAARSVMASDQSMWRVYSSNVTRTSLAGFRVWATPA